MIRTLGRFIPSALDGKVIASELRAWLLERSIQPQEPQIGVRTPEDTARACQATPVLMEWHRDGCAEPTNPKDTPSVKTLVVWSNGTGTGIRRFDGFEWQPNPFDVTLFDNVNAWHRSPPPEEGRWFIGIADPVLLGDTI
jgi:hypothetical protein